MNRNLKGSLLAAVILTSCLGISFRVPEMRAQAVTEGQSAPEARAGTRTTPEGQSAETGDREVDENEAYLHSPMVVKLGAMLGMNADRSAIAFQVSNFVLLAVGVGWVAWRTLPKLLSDRSSAIQKHLVDARTATEEASARLNSVEERLGKLDGQIAALRAQAEQDAARDEARIKAAAEEQTKNIVASAEQEIAAATSHAQKQLQQYAAELAIEQAGRRLVVSAETDRLLVQSFAQRLAGDVSKKGQN